MALLAICFLCFCVALMKWYIYLEDRGAVAIMGLTSLPAGLVSGLVLGLMGAQFGRKYLALSALFGFIFGIFSNLIFAILSTSYSRLFKHK